jgi:putative FmdB family regulatory protein
MPTYDYICTSCGNAWELEQRIVENPVKKCPKCGANTAKRQISQGAGFILKGGGWYADGYGSKKPSTTESKPDASDTKSAEKPAGGDGSAKTGTEKKPAAETGSGGGGGTGENKPSGGTDKPSGGTKASAA